MIVEQWSYKCPKCSGHGVTCENDMREVMSCYGIPIVVNMGTTYSCPGCDERLFKDDIAGTFHNRDQMTQLEKDRIERRRHDSFYAGQALF